MIRLSESEEDRAFLQKRVGLFGLVTGGGYLFFWLYRTVMMLARGYTEGFSHPSYWWHLVAASAFLALWALNRPGTRSLRFIRTAEVTALCVGVLATGIMAMSIRFADRPDFILLLAFYNVVLGRAIFVPSSGRWTFTIGVVIGVLMLASVYVGTLAIDLEKWAVLYPEIADRTPQQVSIAVVVEIFAWWALAIMSSTMTSVVIYGLRRQVREAEQLGQYRLEEKLGEGGMGVVYRARHALLRRPTAVKLLRPERAGAENIRRFEQEVQMTAGLKHPHTITIFDYGLTADGIFYYAMEYIDGLSLTDVVSRSGPQPQGRVAEIFRQAASALVEAHDIGLVHRDIKPSNIMLQLLSSKEGDFVKVLDFGLVKEVRREGGIDLTNDANIAGTPQYMAPESILSPESVDARTDIYALGAVAYYLLTGTHLFDGRSIVEVSSHHLHTAPEPPSSRVDAPIAKDLEKLVLQCLEKDPADRPQTAFDLLRLLSACDGISEWTQDDAQRWWKESGQSVSSKALVGTERTLAVNWGDGARVDPDQA